MLTSIHIQGFKGFRDTKIPELRRVNLILGGQNSGKTSLLEAVYVGHKHTTDSEQVANLLAKTGFRKSPPYRAKAWTKYSGYKQDIKVAMQPERRRPDQTSDVSCFTVYPIEERELVKLYITAVKKTRKEDWLKMLRLIEPRLADLDQFPPGDESDSVVHAKIGLHELIPLSELGQGFNRLAYLYAGLLGQNANIALIDEIENGIHYTALPILWQGIANIARELDIQIFATTHSKECIRAACEALKDSPDDFQVIRLVRKDDNIEAQIIPYEYVEATLEMRGELR